MNSCRENNDTEMLMLSGIQHFKFCKRQWALIHILQQWAENRLTVEGAYMHRNADTPSYDVSRDGAVILRAVNLSSQKLGLYGVADIVELIPADDENFIAHPKFKGRWMPIPVEYKRGRPKENTCDDIAQGMCLEEAGAITVPYGFIFYGQTRRRKKVEFNSVLRSQTEKCAQEMHKLFAESTVPNASFSKACDSCSLYDLCMPKCAHSAKKYLEILGLK